MTASYICVTYGFSLRRYEGFWVDSQRLVDGIHLLKHDRREPRVLVAVMGRFKGEDINIMHLFPLVNVTSSGIRIRMWLERLVSLLKEEGNNNFPAFCDVEGYMLSAAAI